ncbi:MAG: GNAT family N-acetyltransferase [Solobacterium sp.]|jgi:RimJ/RimL family protein N-acetyltransferase|nr:GNAT family N-acetyltransferase [Solobacterium sp.]MCH4047939.1 GNAT family N-acetyltransferase [Solobacterium sp.]MCH4075475.1 GNAT family N-acetyltransferase [Solobacterium sp.]MCI1313642.1 GNAT family N-acetyltransferase [Solobacterium sp.]MCI1346211.1 GNAT family N-acetyltransferase [Solobacterium sp.]
MENRWIHNGYVLRAAVKEDMYDYCMKYAPLDAEAAHMTCNPVYSDPSMVMGFFDRVLKDENYHLFVLLNPKGQLIGETALNEGEDNTASFRICIFDPDERGKGLGSWAIGRMMQYAFDALGMEEINLEVLSENERAIAAYRHHDFISTGREDRMILMECRRRQYEKEKRETERSEPYRFSLQG